MGTRIQTTDEYEAWVSALRDERAQARIDVRIRRLGLETPGDSKSVGGGVCEMRIDYGPGYRVYYTRRGNALVILLVGGDKSTQRRDIARAKELAASIFAKGDRT